MAMKREGDFGGAPAPKVQNTGAQQPPEGQGEMWTCKDCGNENWPLRTTCNRCKSPGPWTCPSCSNKNFQGRMVCNRTQCRQPRPGTGSLMQHTSLLGPNSFPPGKGSMLQRMMMPQQQTQLAGHPPGSWTCAGCQNVNWPMRTSCKKCQISRAAGEAPQVGRLPSAFAAPSAFVSAAQFGAKGGQQGEHPPGSWVCTSCANVNWPKRTTCKKCEAPKEQVDGGPPQGGAAPQYWPPQGGAAPQYWPAQAPQPANQGKGGAQGQHPPGSWVCTNCANVNWPMRTTCKKCESPKEQVDGGPPQASNAVAAPQWAPVYAPQQAPQFGGKGGSQGEHPPGSWVCTNCANVNWPKRTTCKKCESPKEQVDGGPPQGGSAGAAPQHAPINLQAQAAGKGGAQGGHPAGSWMCTGCENVNWPMRTTCKKCNSPKDQVDGGPPQGENSGTQEQNFAGHPPGSWACQCGNVNWPMRTTCKMCGKGPAGV